MPRQHEAAVNYQNWALEALLARETHSRCDAGLVRARQILRRVSSYHAIFAFSKRLGPLPLICRSSRKHDSMCDRRAFPTLRPLPVVKAETRLAARIVERCVHRQNTCSLVKFSSEVLR